MTFRPEHDELLSRLEQSELALLSWGRVDGALAENEVKAAARAVAGSENRADDLVDDLIAWHLLLDVGKRDVLYRTRFAESVRLLVRNRQLTPSRSWKAAPELVNDFRVVARPRRFPRRDQTLSTVLARLDAERSLRDEERRALRSMLTTADGELELARFQCEATEYIRERLADGSTAATMVCAGTGSGKTKAFYLPVISSVAADAASDSSRWARVLAIYPRNELLKDQFAEALAQVDLVAEQGGPGPRARCVLRADGAKQAIWQRAGLEEGRRRSRLPVHPLPARMHRGPRVDRATTGSPGARSSSAPGAGGAPDTVSWS